MANTQSRRSFLRSAPLAAAAAASLPLTGKALFAEPAADMPTPEKVQLVTADQFAGLVAKTQATPGNENLFAPGTLPPVTVVLTTEVKKAGKEFEMHEFRDHIFRIVEGSTIYELGGTLQNARNTKPGEWLAPASTGATTYNLKKGDMILIPRGTPHRRNTETSVTLILISSNGIVKA